MHPGASFSSHDSPSELRPARLSQCFGGEGEGGSGEGEGGGGEGEGGGGEGEGGGGEGDGGTSSHTT